MITYLTVFGFSIISFYIGIHSKRHDFKFFCMGISILSLSILAGCRDYSVGTDTLFYAEGMFEEACNSKDFCIYIQEIRGELFYGIINYFVSRFTDNLGVLLFVVQFITLLPIYYVLCVDKDIRKPTLALIIYLFIFYNMSYNLIRQMLAVNFLFLLFYYLRQGKTKLYIIGSILNIFFHTTSIIGSLLLYIIYKTFKEDNNIKKILLVGGIMGAILIFKIYFEQILAYIISFNFLEKYQFYSSDYQESGTNLTEILIRFFFLMIAFGIYMLKNRTKEVVILFFIIVIVEVFIFTLSSISQYLFRFAFYLSILHIYFVPYLISMIYSKSLRFLLNLTTFLAVFSFWYWLIVFKNVNATIPYTSKFLGID